MKCECSCEMISEDDLIKIYLVSIKPPPHLSPLEQKSGKVPKTRKRPISDKLPTQLAHLGNQSVSIMITDQLWETS